MAWTSPKTFVSLEVLTASELNTYVRDNMLALYPTWQTYTPTFGGFSTAPTIGRVAYVLVGKMCILTVFMSSGTSNANFFTMTAPFTAANISGAEWRASLAFYISGGSIVRGQGDVRLQANSNEIAIATASGFTSWATTGNKSANFQLIYEVA